MQWLTYAKQPSELFARANSSKQQQVRLLQSRNREKWKYCHFSALFTKYNAGMEEIRVEAKVKPYQGIVYFAVSVFFRTSDQRQIYGVTFTGHEQKCVFTDSRLA